MNMKNKKILITGITGFLGSNLAKRLINTGCDIVAIKRSFSNTFRLNGYADRINFYNIDEINARNIFKDNDIGAVIHCATSYGRKNTSPVDILQANLMMPLYILELACEYKTSYYINTDTILDKRVSTYSLSKKQFLDWLLIYSDKLKCINVSLEHFYGPYDDKTKFVSNMIMDMLSGKKIIDLTKGEQKRDFVYIDDVVDAFMTIIMNISKIEVSFMQYEVGCGESIKIRDFVEKIKIITGNTSTKLNFGALAYRANEVMESKANISELKKLGWTPKYTIDDGLIKTIEIEKRGIKQ
jgi:nucleoside-diphosphate-sugar epimerase